MKIAFLVNYFPPEIGSAADLFYQLSKELGKRGHTIEVFTTEPRHYNIGHTSQVCVHRKRKKWRTWEIEQREPNVTIHRIKLVPFIYPRSGSSLSLREMEHVFQPLMYLLLIYRIARAEAIIAYSPPLLLGCLASLIGRLLNIPTAISVQDIHPDAIIDLGFLKNSLLIRIFTTIERMMYRFAGSITVHSEGNVKLVTRYGIPTHKVSIVHNCCSIPPADLLKEGSIFVKKYALEDKFVVTYAGIMSFSQDLHTIVKAAKLLSTQLDDVEFVLAGNGPLRDKLLSQIKQMNVRNVRLLPFQLGDDYWRMLAGSDVCLVSLKKGVKTPVVPRKLIDIMAAGKPVLANVPLDGDVSKLIQKAESGESVEPENAHALTLALEKIYRMNEEERSRMGRNGRAFALKQFTSSTMARKYEAIFERLSFRTRTHEIKDITTSKYGPLPMVVDA